MAQQHAHNHTPATINPGNVSRAFLISIVLNCVYVVVEVGGGLLYNSMALLTDAGHNISDIASLLLSMFAFKLAARKPDSTFTYGYKKTTVLASLANAVILLIAIGVLGYETILRFMHPAPVEGGIIAWLAGVGIVINSVSAWLFFKSCKHDLNVKSAYIHLMADALVSVGVVAGGIVIHFTGWYILDPLIGLVVLLVILVSTWGLLSDSFKLSVDAVPHGINLETIKALVNKLDNVVEIYHVHIWAISTTENAITAHVKINPTLNFAQKLSVIKDIKHLLHHQNIQHSTLEINEDDNDRNC